MQHCKYLSENRPKRINGKANALGSVATPGPSEPRLARRQVQKADGGNKRPRADNNPFMWHMGKLRLIRAHSGKLLGCVLLRGSGGTEAARGCVRGSIGLSYSPVPPPCLEGLESGYSEGTARV